jgi:hypothetical protein
MLTAVQPPRRRLWILVGVLLVVLAGLATRSGLPLPWLVATYGGDTLYAVLIYLLLAAVVPGASTGAMALGAGLVCVGVELSQLSEAGWLVTLRSTRLGALVLGKGFLWSDLACYTVGVGLAAAVDGGLLRWGHDRGVEPSSGQEKLL